MQRALKSAVAAIEKNGVLLVYPIDNRPEPPSLWSSFYPRREMRWEWDDAGDDRVASLWHLREELSRSRHVVYAKWFRGRATFFSRDMFAAFLTVLQPPAPGRRELSTLDLGDPYAERLLEALRADSPQSTKQLKLATDLRGRDWEPTYERAMKRLWARLLIVGFGEFDDGAFPSLGIGATQLLFEELWERSRENDPAHARAEIARKLPATSPFLKQLARVTAVRPDTGAAVAPVGPRRTMASGPKV